MSILIADCPTCKEKTAHESEGKKEDNDGRSCQSMKCKTCGTTTIVYFDPNSNDFQINYEWPNDSDA